MSMYSASAREEVEDQSSPSVDKTGRCSVDALLRGKDYAIYERRKGREPLWVQGRGRPVLQSVAVASLTESERAGAEQTQRRYLDELTGDAA